MIGTLIKLAIFLYVGSLIYRKIKYALAPIKNARDAYNDTVSKRNVSTDQYTIEICPECGVEKDAGHKCK
jgi:hypothetical protein